MNEIKVPKEIQIGGHTYKLYFNEMVEKDGHYATLLHDSQEVWFCKGRPQTQMVQTFLHEMVHIISRAYCVSRLEERDIDLLSEGLMQLLVSNFGITMNWGDIEEIIPDGIKK